MSALIPINNINVPFEVVGENLPTVSSAYVAEVFDKGHHNILRLISNLPDDEFKSENFKESSYLNKQNKKQPCYNLTRDGFSLLVMGFTGEKAYRWKIEFIKAFNMMEAELKRLSVSRYVDEISSLNATLINKQSHHERQINGYKSQIKQHNQKIVILKHELAKYEKACECEIIDENNPKFKPFDKYRPSYMQLWREHIGVLGNNTALKIFIEQYKREVADLKSKLADKSKLVQHLANAQSKLDEAYRTIGAVMSYTDGDKYFLEHNQITKDIK